MKYLKYSIIILIVASLVYVVSPSKTFEQQGLRGSTNTDSVKVIFESLGKVGKESGKVIYDVPPYDFNMFVIANNDSVSAIRILELSGRGCGEDLPFQIEPGETKKTFKNGYGYRGMSVVRHFDTNTSCLETISINFSFELLDSNGKRHDTTSGNLELKPYQKTPSKIGFWWTAAMGI